MQPGGRDGDERMLQSPLLIAFDTFIELVSGDRRGDKMLEEFGLTVGQTNQWEPPVRRNKKMSAKRMFKAFQKFPHEITTWGEWDGKEFSRCESLHLLLVQTT